MTSPFPQLLRRSKFAAHDPLITRVYTSTPSSVHQHGDWGMKYPIHRPKGPKYISVNEFDTGTILGSDWRSAEKEARFMENWGKAGRWTNKDLEEQKRSALVQAGMPSGSRQWAERDLESERQEAEEKQDAERGRMYLPDVNAMSQKEFKRYIAIVRKERGTFLATKLAGMRGDSGLGAQSRRSQGDGNGDESTTLVSLATGGLTSNTDPTHFQATLAHSETTSKDTTQIHSTPHQMYGLTYAQTTSAASTDPLPGRVVSRNQFPAGRTTSPYAREVRDDNKPWVVSVGGLTGQLSNGNASVKDSKRAEQTDYTRADPKRGEYTFRIQKAELQAPPTVQNLQQANRALRWGARWGDRRMGAKQPSPFDSFQFDIQLSDFTDSATASTSNGQQTAEPGSKEWVGQEVSNRMDRFGSREDSLGLGVGSPRNTRTRGETVAQLGALERKAAREAQRRFSENNNNASSDLVRKLGLFKRQAQNESEK